MGSSVPNTAAAAPSPSTATGAAAAVSASSKKRPLTTRRLAIDAYEGLTP